MQSKRICKTTLSKNFQKQKSLPRTIMDKKIDLEALPFTTVKVTIRMLKWIFLLIFLYISVSIFILIIQGGNESIRNIIVYSISGFFTFFMGYFGWMFARNVMEIFYGKNVTEEEF